MTRLPLNTCLAAILVWVLAFPLGAWSESPESRMVSFSADVKRLLTDRKTTVMGKLFVSPEGIRSETVRNGMPVILIHKPTRKTIWTVFPNEKSYMERTGIAISRPPLPDEAESPCRTNKGFMCRQVGTETLLGRSVMHWEIVIKGPERDVPHAHLWVDTRLQIAIREHYADGLVVELTNIQEGPQPATLFAIPTEYQKVAPPAEATPSTQ
ncbi:MAG: DUF4412 domain-containing protein [Magnetococcus sp. YQC-5]